MLGPEGRFLHGAAILSEDGVTLGGSPFLVLLVPSSYF